MTKSDKYEPTAAEKKLLEVLLNPESAGKSITDICNLAGISRNKYYKAMSKQEFSDLVSETTVELVKAKAANVLNASYKFALEEKNFQDRKLILTLAGIYVEKQQTELTGSVDLTQSAREIDDYIKELKRGDKQD